MKILFAPNLIVSGLDGGDRARILEAAPSVLARYSWANAAQQTLEAIETAARMGD